MNIGKAIGGPIDGKEISGETEKVVVPVKTGPDRGEGDRGFSAAIYRWESHYRQWIYQEH